MKKTILSLAMAAVATMASAQTSYNVRMGGGLLYETFVGTIMGQADIPVKSGSNCVFSPALQFSVGADNVLAAMAHANVGYRVRIGEGALFVPKVGFAAGYVQPNYYYDYGFLAGPSMDLAIEVKHFVIGITAFYSINSATNIESSYDEGDCIPMLSLTFGYRF